MVFFFFYFTYWQNFKSLQCNQLRQAWALRIPINTHRVTSASKYRGKKSDKEKGGKKR